MVRIHRDRSDDAQPEQSGLSCNDDQLALRSVRTVTTDGGGG